MLFDDKQMAKSPGALDQAQEQISKMDPKFMQSMLKAQGIDIPEEQVHILLWLFQIRCCEM